MTELSREAFLAAAVAAKDTFIEETDACIEKKIAQIAALRTENDAHRSKAESSGFSE